MRTSKTIGLISAAFAKAQSEFKNPKFDSKNPHFGNEYVSLHSLLDAVIPPLNKQGILLAQDSTTEYDGRTWLATRVVLGEEWLEGLVPLIVDDASAQKTGSGLTYAKRQGICALCGISGEEDDDAEAAEPKTKPAKKSKAPKKPEETDGKTVDQMKECIKVWLREMSNDEPTLGASLLKTASMFKGDHGYKWADHVDDLTDAWTPSVYGKLKKQHETWTEAQMEGPSAVD